MSLYDKRQKCHSNYSGTHELRNIYAYNHSIYIYAVLQKYIYIYIERERDGDGDRYALRGGRFQQPYLWLLCLMVEVCIVSISIP